MPKLKIFIGKDYNNEITGIILSDEMVKAQIAFQAMQATVFNIEEIDLNDMPPSSTNTFFIMSSQEVPVHNLDRSKTIRRYKRGL